MSFHVNFVKFQDFGVSPVGYCWINVLYMANIGGKADKYNDEDSNQFNFDSYGEYFRKKQ